MSLELDPAKTALVVIDMTKRVFSLESRPHPIQEVLTKTARLARAFRQAGSFVVLVRVSSRDGKDVLKPITDPTPPALLPPAPVQRTEDWSDLVSELGSHPLDHLVTKHQWGAFFGTDLDLQLRRRQIETIVLPLRDRTFPSADLASALMLGSKAESLPEADEIHFGICTIGDALNCRFGFRRYVSVTRVDHLIRIAGLTSISRDDSAFSKSNSPRNAHSPFFSRISREVAPSWEIVSN